MDLPTVPTRTVILKKPSIFEVLGKTFLGAAVIFAVASYGPAVANQPFISDMGATAVGLVDYFDFTGAEGFGIDFNFGEQTHQPTNLGQPAIGHAGPSTEVHFSK